MAELTSPTQETPSYIHLRPGEEPPELPELPYRFVVVADTAVSADWREDIAAWIFKTGSRYVVAWGQSCEDWHDSVDFACLEAFDFGPVPDKDHIMTTWHSDEPLSEAFWFAGFCAFHPDVELRETIILHIAEEPRKASMLEEYKQAQSSD